MIKFNLTRLELSILCVAFLLLLTGVTMSFMNSDMFANHYTAEDGFIEWLTVFGLLTGTGVCFYRANKLYKMRGIWFSIFTISLGILMVIAAGEEISWGQRIFNIESTEYFQKYNSQQETNFHNMVFNGVRMNRVIFSLTLFGIMVIYLIFLPIAYRKNIKVKDFIDSNGIIIPKNYQTISFVIMFLLSTIVPHEKRAELVEFGAVFLFLLIVWFPLNNHIFKNSSQENYHLKIKTSDPSLLT
jgi:hypothetical protein